MDVCLAYLNILEAGSELTALSCLYEVQEPIDMLVSPLARKVARNSREGMTATEIASETGIPPEKVQIALDELESKLLLTVDEYGLVHFLDSTTADERNT